MSTSRSPAHYLTESEPLRELQRIFLIDERATRKAVAPLLEWNEDTLGRCITGQKDLPAKKLPALYFALGRYRGIFQCLLSQTDLIVVPRPVIAKRRLPLVLLTELTLSFGSIYESLAKLVRRETLTEEERRLLEEEATRIKGLMDEVIDVARSPQPLDKTQE